MKEIEKAHLLRLATLVCIAIAGMSVAFATGWQGLEHSWIYILTASALLCFGLYMAVYGIDKAEAKNHWRIVLIAVTFGVLCKYLIIFGITYAATRNWHYAVLGMAVAQIDPLSVAALQSDPRMNTKTKTILNMWASFDDPMTALATPILLGIAANVAHERLASGSSWQDVLVDIVPFAAALLFVGLLALRRRMNGQGHLLVPLENSEHVKNGAVGIAWVATALTRLYSVMAMIGWFIRPKWLGEGKRADILTDVALYGSTLLLGILLAGGIDIKGGLILGVATYGSQMIVAWAVVWLSTVVSKREAHATHRLSRRDTWHLALSQQNGITAIVLALNLEPVISGAVAAVSLAIVVVNLLNFAANWVFDRLAPVND